MTRARACAACEPLGPYRPVRLERTFERRRAGPVPHAARARRRRASSRGRSRPSPPTTAGVDVPVRAARRRRSPRSRGTGAEVEVLGPFGHGFDLGRGGRAPAARRRRLRRRAARAARAARCRRAALLAGFRDAEARARPPSSCRRPSARSCCAPGHVTEPLAPRLAGRRPRCSRPGPTASCAPSPRPAPRRGVPCQVALEAPMACGYGACYGCAVRLDGRLVRLCVEGPVVDAASAWRRRERRARNPRRRGRARASGA